MAIDSQHVCDHALWAHPDPWYVQGVDRLATGTDVVEKLGTGSLASTGLSVSGVFPAGRDRRDAWCKPTIGESWTTGLGLRSLPGKQFQHWSLPSASHLAGAAARMYPASLGSGLPVLLLQTPSQEKLFATESSVVSSRSMAVVLQRVCSILELDEGWDGEGGRQIDRPSLARMLMFVDRRLPHAATAPSVVPMSNGGIQIEWHRAGVDVEVSFEPDEEDELFFLDLASAEEWEGSPEDGFSRFRLADLLSRDNAAVS